MSRKRTQLPSDAFGHVVEQMNAKYAIGPINGKVRVLWKGTNDGGLPQLSSVEDLRVLHRNQMVAGHNPVDVWIGSSQRCDFDRIAFEPDGAPPRVHNLFAGFATKPKAGDCGRLLDHMHRVICGGDTALCEWLLDYLADIAQHPAQPKGTAIVMRGPQGAGKGQFAQYVRAVFAPYTSHLISPDLLIGRFNDHFSAKLIIYADEASWPGDRRGIGKLKGLITEQRILVERKNVPAFEISNYARLFISTNEDWACPADIDDRRFVMLDIGGSKRDDREYWNALSAEREGGGPATLMAMLMRRHIARDLRTAPSTSALGEQKLLSLDPIGQFWRRLLLARRHTLLIPGGTTLRITFGEPVGTTVIYKFYLSHAQETRLSHTASIDALGKRLRRLCPSLVKREARRGEAGDDGTARPQVYELPIIEDARAEFSAALRQGFAFGEPDEVQEWR
jgi:hypothetical protein